MNKRRRLSHLASTEAARKISEQISTMNQAPVARDTGPRKDYWQSNWGQMLKEPSLSIPTSKAARLFRRRFRVPYLLFKDVLVPQCKQAGIGSAKSYAVPIELRILIVLRILGKDGVYDDCSNETFAGESTVASIFKSFLVDYTSKFYDDFVHMPKGDDLLNVLEVYRKLGFPGCVGSIDCTHITWQACNKNYRFLCVGKSGFPTLSFQAVVSHDRFVYSISPTFLGATNDLTISRNDPSTVNMSSGYLDEIEYVLYSDTGVPMLCKGGYLLCDKGYPRLAMYMAPDVPCITHSQLHWAEYLESVRKDVECFFGVMKARWWLLRNAARYHDPETVGNAFRMAAILHNMLLAYDGLITECGNNTESFWEQLNPDGDEMEEDGQQSIDGGSRSGPSAAAPRASSCSSSSSFSSNARLTTELAEEDENVVAVPPEAQEKPHVITMFQLAAVKHTLKAGYITRAMDNFGTFRDKLIQHFYYQFAYGDLWWPRAKLTATTLPSIEARVLLMSNEQLYHKESALRSRDPITSCLVSCGEGLFSKMSYSRGQTVAFFSGSFISETEKLSIEDALVAKYVIKVLDKLYYNCYHDFCAGKSWASYANSPKQAYYFDNGNMRSAMENCKLVYDPKSKTARLVAIKTIAADEELLWYYPF